MLNSDQVLAACLALYSKRGCNTAATAPADAEVIVHVRRSCHQAIDLENIASGRGHSVVLGGARKAETVKAEVGKAIVPDAFREEEEESSKAKTTMPANKPDLKIPNDQ